jgi:hypothetical protein
MLERRALIKTPAGAVYRLLDAFPDRAEPVAYLFSMEDEKALPRSMPLSELVDGLRNGEYIRVGGSTPVVVRAVSSPNDKKEDDSPAYLLFKWRCDLIRPLISNPLIYERKHRGRLVAERAKEATAFVKERARRSGIQDAEAKATSVSEQTVMTCLRLYWRGGMTFDALMPEFDKCGTAKTPSNTPQAARGRKPARYKTFQWNDDLKKKVVRTLKAVLRKSPRATNKLLYRRVLSRHFSTATLVEENGKQKTIIKQLAKGERPSRTQLYYLIDQAFSLEERLRQKLGDDNFENNVDPKTGSAREYAQFAGNIYEIDATKVDCWIVDDDDPQTVIGKATLYLVIDVFTRLIVGFHLTLDSPSWAGAMEALMTLVEDKRKLCERWDMEYREADWPAHGVVPAFIRSDRGAEFTSYAREVLTDALGLHYINVPARKSPTRGTVECGHKLVHIPIRENVGGHTPPEEFGKRQISDHRDEASRTLKSLGTEIGAGVLLNNRRVHTRVDLPAAQVWAKEQAIPIRMWELSTQSVGLHSTHEETFMRFKCLPSDDMSVTPRGVFYKGLLYIPEPSLKQQWLLPATKGFYNVRATFDRRSVATIYVHDKKDPTKWTTMHLSPELAKHHGRSWAQFELLKVAKLTLADLAEEHNLQLELQNDHEAEERERASQAAAQKAIRAAKSKSRTADTSKKRAAAVDKEHASVPVLPTTAAPAPSSVPRKTPVAAIPEMPRPPTSAPEPAKLKTVATSNNKLLQSLLNLKAKT